MKSSLENIASKRVIVSNSLPELYLSMNDEWMVMVDEADERGRTEKRRNNKRPGKMICRT